MLKTRGGLLAKVETTYGTDAAPTEEANAILCEPPTIEVIQKSLERNNIKSYFGALSRVNVGEGLKLTFVTELKGSGAAGTAPEIGPLLRACNFSETTVPATSVAYAPNSYVLDSESITIWFWQDGLRHAAVGCRGTFKVDLKAGEYGKITWEFQGIYAGPIDAPVRPLTFNETIPARFVSANFTIDSFAAVVENLKLDAGNEIGRRPSINASTGMLSYFIKERSAKGEIDPEATHLAEGSVLAIAATPTAGGTGYSANDILTISAGGTGATARVLTVDTGAVTSVRLLTGGSGYTTGTGKATTVAPSGGTGCTLNITSVSVAADSKDFWTMWSGNSRVALAATLGASAGNICAMAAPKVQLTEMKYGERESLLTYALPFVCTPNAGNDELTFTFT